jgi:hypothetical protein
MSVVVTSREYKNRYRPEIVDWLLGNVGDWQTLTLNCNFAIEKKFTQSKPLMLENSGLDLVLGDGTNWNEYGFDLGDAIVIKVRIRAFTNDGALQWDINPTITKIIQLIQGDRIVLDTPITNDINMLPTEQMVEGGKHVWDNLVIYSDKKPQGAEIMYGHLKNSEADNGNLASFIDGTYTRVIAEYMHTLTGWQNCGFIGLQSGMSLRSARWIFDEKEGTHTYKYRFELEFMISSFFEDLTNFETMTAPSQVFDAESLTDNFEVIGYPEWNNPNTQIKSDKKATKRLGNTGWFNENYNGLDNDFEVLSVEYTDVVSNSPTQRLSYGAETKVKAVIQGVPNLANGLTKLGIGFIFLPEREDIYRDKETPFQQNLLVNTAGGLSSGIFTPSATPTAITYTGFTNNAGERMDVRNVHFYLQGGNLVYEAIFSPTAGFGNYIDSLDDIERNYALWISVADRTEVTNFADRVSLLLDYNYMDLFVPPVGEWQPMSIGFIEHPYDETGFIRDGECGDFRVEDDLLTVIPFKVDTTDEIPTKMEFVIEMENTTTGAKFELQRHAVDLTGYPNNGAGVPQWNYDQSRGFKLEDGNSKNWVKIERDETEDDGNEKGYKAYYGFKIRWEDWILRTGVPSDFFNAMEENNGFNNDWLQYLNVGDWVCQFTVYTYAPLNGSGVKYVNEKRFNFKDYDVNENIETEWAILRESDGTNLPMSIDAITGKPMGVLLENEQVRLQCVYRKLNGSFASLSSFYGTLCIEVDKGAGQFDFRQLSSVWGSESDNPLIPLTGETRTKKTLLSPNEILLECLVEPSLLTEAVRYKLSSRLGCDFECEDVVINQDTKILMYFDNSGSMNSTLTPLTTMKDTILKQRLLPFYNNDSALYDASVTITNVPSERTLDMLNMLAQTPPTGNVIVMVFQDESSPAYHGTTITPRKLQYDNDLTALLNRLNSYVSGYYRGLVFVVEGNVQFTQLITAIENGIVPYDGQNGLLGRNEFGYYYNVTDGGTPQYYLDLVVQGLNDLGYNV